MAKYYDHKCGCGCGGKIEKKPYHKFPSQGIPKVKKGHGNRSSKEKEWFEKNKDRKILCKCGRKNCYIKIKLSHYYNGIPKYNSGHNGYGEVGYKRSPETLKKTVIRFKGLEEKTLDVLVSQMGHKPNEAKRLITDALARNDSIKTPEDLVKEIIQNGL